MDQRDMQSWLNDHLRQIDWSRGVTKAELMDAVQDDEALRSMIGQYVVEGTYQSIDQVCTLIPEQAWQDAQGDEWRGGEIHDMPDMPSNWREGKVGQDESNVYRRGAGGVPTPGFGETNETGEQPGG